jgi:hypothetical protein
VEFGVLVFLWLLLLFGNQNPIYFNPPSRSASADEKAWVNSPGLAPEERVQDLPWGLIPFIKNVNQYILLILQSILFQFHYLNEEMFS